MEKSRGEIVDSKKKRRKFPNVFFKKEIIKVFDNIDNPKTMVASFLTFFCALRMSDVCKLKWKDIDIEEKRLKIVDGKNHKDGFIPISSVCIPILQRWRAMNEKQEYFLPPTPTKEGVLHYCQHALLADFKKALARAGMNIETERNAKGYQQHQYKFHTLRHSRCTHLLSNGVPIEKVQKFMRHDEIDTTMTYTWILDKELNTMVENADSKIENVLPEEFSKSPLHLFIQKEEEPFIIAQKRLAKGEINIREYKKLIGTLNNTPIQIKASIQQNQISEQYITQ